ncbi:B9 domain-containing protein 1, partial [Pseudolycoriella hygida]
NCFHINLSGQIKSCCFPSGFDGDKLFCRYDIVAGADWDLVSGITSGVTQLSKAGPRIEEIVFNMPLEVMYKSTNPFGWPQLILCLYGNNFWGTETSRGYARCHLPVTSGEIRAPIFQIRCSNIWSSITSWFSDRRPELRNPKILVEGEKTKGLSVESYGEVVIFLQTVTRGAGHLSLDWGQR